MCDHLLSVNTVAFNQAPSSGHPSTSPPSTRSSNCPLLQVPSYGCELKVSGLNPNERYVFAVAAYTADGKLVGNSIGETSKPILASHPLPILMTWAFLSQVRLLLLVR